MPTHLATEICVNTLHPGAVLLLMKTLLRNQITEIFIFLKLILEESNYLRVIDQWAIPQVFQKQILHQVQALEIERFCSETKLLYFYLRKQKFANFSHDSSFQRRL